MSPTRNLRETPTSPHSDVSRTGKSQTTTQTPPTQSSSQIPVMHGPPRRNSTDFTIQTNQFRDTEQWMHNGRMISGGMVSGNVPRCPIREPPQSKGAPQIHRDIKPELGKMSTSTPPPPLPQRPPAVPKRTNIRRAIDTHKPIALPSKQPATGASPGNIYAQPSRTPALKSCKTNLPRVLPVPPGKVKNVLNDGDAINLTTQSQNSILLTTLPAALDSSTLTHNHLFGNSAIMKNGTNQNGNMASGGNATRFDTNKNNTARGNKVTGGLPSPPPLTQPVVPYASTQASRANEFRHQSTSSTTFGSEDDESSDSVFNNTCQTANKPPPLSPVVTNTPIHKSLSNNKISTRQDSNVSSDSFSQTSSPSYTTKTMEAPLLPNHHIVASSRSHCNGNIGSKIVASKKHKEKIKNEETNSNATSITKSASTPASLQTIVRFHNGSNMSLHHRIIRDIRRPSSHYVSGVRFRFRFAQVLVNAIALLAISGGLAAYFKAYPTSMQVVNNSVTIKSEAPQSGFNPAPGICLPVIVNFCLNQRVPYNFTVFPNYMGHFSQRDAQQELELYEAVIDVRCYELAALFLCSVFVPKCGQTGQVVRPCRSLCFETKRRCGFFLDVFGLSLPDYLECGLFPESTDPEVCVGHKEVKEAKLRAQKPVCNSGFQCDSKRCIPADWQCDGHVDCKDQSDELNCKQCAKGMIHCGEEHCMSQEHMCDGIIQCPWGQDERNCLRLSDSNGDEGHGQLEVFLPEHQRWVPACVTHWDPATSANEVCSLLGYTSSNWSRFPVKTSDLDISPPSHETLASWRMHKKKTNFVKEFRECAGNSHPTVNLTCTDYACGKIRKTYKQRTKRIVGGVESSPGDWPFLAALLGGPEEVFYCAGVLIADQWVLTASHCVGNHSDVSGWTIQLGITRRHSHSYYGQKMKVRRVVPHPMYNLEVAHDNDVALFQLASRVTFHEYLLPVCLPPPNRELVPGTICTVIGWGKREDKGMSEYEPAVNEVQVPVLNRDLCNAWLEHRDLNVTEGMICAGYPEGGKDACQGDSGGPLLCRDEDDPDRWFVGGIVSWGIKCAHPHLPGVYAYVPRYISWINQQISQYSD